MSTTTTERAPVSAPWQVARRDASRSARGWLQLAPLLPLYVVVTAVTQPWGQLAGDEGSFLGYAHRLLHGQYAQPHAVDPGAFLWHGPGVPVVLTPFVALGLPIEAMRFLMPVLLFAGVLVFHELLRIRLRSRPALVAAYALGLYLPFFQPLRGIHKEPLAILLISAALLGLSRYLEHGRKRTLALAGLAFAALVMVRVEYGWVMFAMLAGCAAWLLLRRTVTARRATAVFAVAVLGCVPWLAYTYSLTDQPLYWGNSGGISLYWMSPTGHGETGQWHAVHTVFDAKRFTPYRPFFAHVTKLSPIGENAEFQRVAMRNIRARPLEYARNIAANAARLWLLMPFWPRPPLGLLAMYWTFGIALVAVSLLALARLLRARRALAPEVMPVIAFAVIALTLHLLPSADPRMTLPIVPALVWLVSYAFARRGGTPCETPRPAA